MAPIHLLLCLLAALGTTSPIAPRAGGPTFEPIPKKCTITNRLPTNTTSSTSTNTTTLLPSGWKLPANFTDCHEIYSSYFSQPFYTAAEQALHCQQQCYGFGERGTCKAILLGYNVPTPEGYYGTEGGELATACLFYDVFLDDTMFVPAPLGQYVNETASNVDCPV
ncbi:hypothetical protein KC363_g6028 [Hortaea werneckii]|uniref:Apple domain-containing protein n=1 Tax=Hortaea werneckii TaxID=91943 RepID=A0A3M7FG13_HORWE|nr:hypothetical protein KC361_g750 [Hortaea werneckii]KAI6882515.1 hypothetical protein KC325_g5735 [Hortaea werneckii]KAI6990896.1 hypothetical protein KC359_g6428 [Hortaea werneckii]KAI7144095.1 hypothetical protein KC344_g5707 [Hortaea werneckii]KAI7171969.1 hypothetical protein KC360_g5813 [Hortaea werneckii]